MDAAQSPAPRAERFDVASLVHAADDDARSEDAPSIDIAGDLNATEISAIVATPAGRVALSPADSAGVGGVGVDAQFDSLAFVPDRRTADRLALAISNWAARQGPAVIDYLYLANARYGHLPTPEGQADAIESLEACQHELDLSEPPSRARYRIWFEHQPPEMEWSTPSAIEIACGNWSRARAAAAGQPLVPIGAVRAVWFGAYPKAVALAARYFDGGTGARAPSRAPTQRPRGSITEEMLLDSVEALFDELGDWPNDADYAAILNAEVLLRAKLGVGDVELYSNTAFNDTFGSYGERRQAAQRRRAERARLREERASSPATATPRNARPPRRRTRSSKLAPPSPERSRRVHARDRSRRRRGPRCPGRWRSSRDARRPARDE